MEGKRPLTVWMIALMNVAAICNIKNFPLMAEYGLASLFFLIFCSLVFFIPVSLVAAELASGWPDRGIYTWVREGLSPRFGFMAIWLQWIANVIWYPTILSFIASTFAYLFLPSLADNQSYVITMILVTFWSATLINLLGMHVSGWISSLTALFGTILPIALIILLGGLWILGGHPVQIDLSWNAFIPNFTSFNELVLLSGFFLGLTGMEMSAVHAREVQHPQSTYPRAIFLSALVIIVLSALGSVVIASIVPIQEIDLTAGSMEAFSALFTAFGMKWAVPIIAGIMTFGALGMMSTWIVGPSRGLLAATEHGDLPPIFHKKNARTMPIAIFVIQAFIVSFLSVLFLMMPSVSASYFILVALASSLNMIMYLLMFLAAIRLRVRHPNVRRTYRVPALPLVALLGMTGPLFVLLLDFFPPSQLDTGSFIFYEVVLIGGTILFCLIPLIIYATRKPSWNIDPNTT
jgi:glutamate:GABA antiporter